MLPNINFSSYYYYLVYTTYLMYALLFFGLLHNEYYITLVSNITQLFIALFLIIRFNPFTKTTFTKTDKKIAFHSGFLLFSINSLYIIFYKLFNIKNNIIQTINV